MVLKRAAFYLFTFLLILVMTACRGETPGALRLPDADQLGPTPTPPPSPVPQRVLSICLGEEPRSLFLYGDQSTSARIVRQAIFDGPVDQVNFEQIPVLLQEIPSQKNELVKIIPVEVSPGERMVDARGNSTFLASGVEFRPAGCNSQDCWEEYTGQPSVELDQVEIHYRMLPGMVWADGQPLTPADSIFSYQTASLVYGTAGPAQLHFTSSYRIGEEGEVIWRGLPGYLGIIAYGDFFFSPLPQHRLENLTREEFLTAPQSNLQPLGWGPYQIKEWVSGDHITLIPNPNYRAASQGLPAFDALVFRFVDSGKETLAAVRSGECQIAANQPDLLSYQPELLSDQRDGRLKIYPVEGVAWEQISMGINSLGKDPSLLQDSDLRLALAGCIDRERISQSRLDAGEVVDDYLLPGRSGEGSASRVIAYQPAESAIKLKELGWIDHDGDPETPRLADGVEGISDGTPLELTLLAADSRVGSITLDYIKEGLGNCGVGLEVQTMPAAELLAPGPDGPIFGRDFDLAYFTWAAGAYQPCRLFVSGEIPGNYPEYPKGWGGVNATGYSNEDFDQACLIVSTNLPDSEAALTAAAELQDLFRSDLPALPLFFRRDLIIAAPEIAGLESGICERFWNIENLE